MRDRETRPVAVNMYIFRHQNATRTRDWFDGVKKGTILTDGDDYTRTNDLTTSQSFDKHLALPSMGIPSPRCGPHHAVHTVSVCTDGTADNKALTKAQPHVQYGTTTVHAHSNTPQYI